MSEDARLIIRARTTAKAQIESSKDKLAIRALAVCIEDLCQALEASNRRGVTAERSLHEALKEREGRR